MDELKLPNDTKLAGKLVEGHVRNEQAKVDRGRLGDFFGSKASVPNNVAAIVSLASALIFICAIVAWAGKPDFPRKEAATALSGIFTLAIGFLFGRSTKD